MFVERMLKHIPFRDKAVLEVGCGPGGVLLEIARRCPRRLVGCDISPKMVELARQNTRGCAVVERVEPSDSSLPFETGGFDVSLTVTVLQHNQDEAVRGLLAEMSRVTSEVICLFEDTTTLSHDLSRYVAAVTGGAVTSHSFFLRRVSDYAALCEANGFKLIDARPLNVYASDLMRMAVWFLDSQMVRSPRRREGERLSGFQASAEKVLLPMTKAMDARLRQRQGLTAMTFRRMS